MKYKEEEGAGEGDGVMYRIVSYRIVSYRINQITCLRAGARAGAGARAAAAAAKPEPGNEMRWNGANICTSIESNKSSKVCKLLA